MSSRSLVRQALAALLYAATAGAWAGDRPYLATNSAAAEEDDDRVWSAESALVRTKGASAWSLAAEYAFDPTTSVQFEWARLRDRSAGSRAQAAEFEVKHLFNHIARDGYGWGLVLNLEFERDDRWRRSGFNAKLPYTLALWAESGRPGALHLNLGIEKPRDGPRENLLSIGLEREVVKRVVLFAEAAREGEVRLLHGGARWLARRERLAIDLSALRTSADGQRSRGWSIGVGFYDL